MLLIDSTNRAGMLDSVRIAILGVDLVSGF
jgi:hypothetical protein